MSPANSCQEQTRERKQKVLGLEMHRKWENRDCVERGVAAREEEEEEEAPRSLRLERAGRRRRVSAAQRHEASSLWWKFSTSKSVEKGKNVLAELIRNASSDLEIITELKRNWLLGNICFLPKDVNKPRMDVWICYFLIFLWAYIELNVKYNIAICDVVKKYQALQSLGMPEMSVQP